MEDRNEDPDFTFAPKEQVIPEDEQELVQPPTVVLAKEALMKYYNRGSMLNGLITGAAIGFPEYLRESYTDQAAALPPFIALLSIKLLQAVFYFYQTARTRVTVMRHVNRKMPIPSEKHLVIGNESRFLGLSGVLTSLYTTHQMLKDDKALLYCLVIALTTEVAAFGIKSHYREKLQRLALDVLKSAANPKNTNK